MKRTTIHISAALALLLGVAACTQDEAGFLPEGAEGTPIVFTATGLNPAATATAGTRAPVDGNWEGVQSVAVLMDGTVKAYNVTPSTSDNTGATLTSDDPHYWTNHTDRLVTAWWPYTEGETTPPAVVVKADQSAREDFEASDLIVAEEQTVSYGNPTLRFTHRTARVTVVLTDYTEGMASVKLTGLSTENGNPAVIAPYYDKGGDTYTALVAPQSVATGTAFITCAFTNGKVFVYKMKEATDWQAGEEYTYTVSLAAAYPGYTDDGNGNYTVTSAEGLKNIAELVNGGKTDINITLDKNIDLTGKEWTPIGTDHRNSYTGTFDGGNHTISGLTVTGSDQWAGLFGYIDKDGTVKNVVLENVQITSDNQYAYVGGVAGYSEGNIENCSVSGSVSGNSNSDGTSNCVGGVVGQQYGGTITECSSSAIVDGRNEVGGVAGKTNSATLTACYATGDVTAERTPTNNTYAGGVVGSNFSSTLIACYATGSVTGTGTGTGSIYVGGVTGDNFASTLTACYHAKGTVSGPDGATGGVTGRNFKDSMLDGGIITACYWNGTVTDGNGIGYDMTYAGETTKVTDGNWTEAMKVMNEKLSGTGWLYVPGPDGLPVLEKKQ